MFGSLLVSLALAGGATQPSDATSPKAVVDKHLVAYNAKNVDQFMSFFAPDAALYEFPDKLLAKGLEEIRKRYAARFSEPNLHAEIVNRVVMGDKVINRERIRRTFPDGPGTGNVVTINEVKDGRITRVWFIVGEQVLDKK